jgi:early secretory antigenic target protein ESAT-6
MTEQTWNFAQISATSANVHSSVMTTQGLLEEGEGALKMLAGVWDGSSSAAYQAVQTKWNGASAELNSALQDLAAKIQDASDTMAQTETHIQSTFPA